MDNLMAYAYPIIHSKYMYRVYSLNHNFGLLLCIFNKYGCIQYIDKTDKKNTIKGKNNENPLLIVNESCFFHCSFVSIG